MRVSQHYDLGLQQPQLEFLDVDVETDTKVFVDPSTFKYLTNDWAGECVALLQDFWDEVLLSIAEEDRPRTAYLLGQLHEPNEAHLGLSKDVSRGSGVSKGLAMRIQEALEGSEAIANGLVSDIEETLLFVEDIDHDRVSDMTINVVRGPLIQFTQRMAQQYGIELVEGLASGPIWNRHTHSWATAHVALPLPNLTSGRLLLIPRVIVRKTGVFDAGDYLQHFVLPYLVHKELMSKVSGLVRHRKDGTPYVTKKSIIERDGRSSKPWNVDVTNEAPEVLEDYKKAKASNHEPMGHDDLAKAMGTPPPDWDALLKAVTDVPSGKKNADVYHRAVQGLLTALLYPALGLPEREVKINNGRKRIDITFVNNAAGGFFHWVINSQKVPAGTVIIECKNYTGPLKNPEFDQLTGRFSNLRGRLGLLCYRGFKDDKAAVVQHCRDAALAGNGFVIALDDDDLEELVRARKEGEESTFTYLYGRFRDLL